MRAVHFRIFLAAVVVLTLPVSAQLPLAKLLWIFPPGASSGFTNDVTVGGSDLDDPVGLRFSDSRITAQLKPGTANQFQVIVPSEVPEGLVDVRFAGRFGVSNPRAFRIGRGPISVQNGNYSQVGDAPLLSRNTPVFARTHVNAISLYRFEAKAGERLFFRLTDNALDSRLVANLKVIHSNGRELAVVRRRSLLDFKAATNGTYFFQVSDHLFRGGDEFGYSLTLTTAPQVEFAVPNVLQRGTTNRVTLYGRGLPNGVASTVSGADGVPLETLEVEIVAPRDAAFTSEIAEFLARPASVRLANESWIWRWTGPLGTSNPIQFTLTTLPVFMAGDDGHPEVVPPCDISGLFPKPGHLTVASFKATKGEVLWLEVFGDRLGQPCNPQAVVQRQESGKDEAGKPIYSDVRELGDTEQNNGDREFNTSHRDSMVRFEVPETGTYRILVRDLFHASAGSVQFPYRLSLRREAPDFDLAAFVMPPPRIGDDRNIHLAPVTLRRGQTAAVRVVAVRRDGFEGEIELVASSLPAGVTSAPARIRSGENTGTVLLTATREATGSGSVVVEGRGKVGEETRIHRALSASVVWPVPDFNNQQAVSRFNREAVVSVIEAEYAPVAVAVGDGRTVEVADEGKFSLTVEVKREGDFNGAFNLKVLGHPGTEKAKEIAIAEKATHATAEWNVADLGLPAGTHTLWLYGTVAGKYRNQPEALAEAEKELKLAEQAVGAATGDGKAKAEERKKAAEEKRKAAEERAKPRDATVAVWSPPFTVTVLPKPAAAKK